MVSRLSMSCLCCKSSEYRMLQFAANAEAMIILSKSWKSYLFISFPACSKVSLSKLTISQSSSKTILCSYQNAV